MSKEIRPQITQITQIGKNSNKEEGQDQLRMVLRNLRHLWTALGSDIRPQITQITQIGKNSNKEEGQDQLRTFCEIYVICGQPSAQIFVRRLRR